MVKHCVQGIGMKILCSLFFLLSVGCSPPLVVIHPIEATDIIAVKQDETFTAPKDGFFLSVEYVKTVMQAKVE